MARGMWFGGIWVRSFNSISLPWVLAICHGNACNLFAPVVLLGPSGPWLCYPVTRFNARDWHRRLYTNDGCRDRDDRIIECLAGAACAVVMSGDITCWIPPLNTISGRIPGSQLPSLVVVTCRPV